VIDPDADLISYLPRVFEFDEPAGTIFPEIAEELGLLPDVIIASNGGDNMMTAFGTGNVSLGTIFSFSEFPVIDPNSELAAFWRLVAIDLHNECDGCH
jgi:xylulokinase